MQKANDQEVRFRFPGGLSRRLNVLLSDKNETQKLTYHRATINLLLRFLSFFPSWLYIYMVQNKLIENHQETSGLIERIFGRDEKHAEFFAKTLNIFKNSVQIIDHIGNTISREYVDLHEQQAVLFEMLIKQESSYPLHLSKEAQSFLTTVESESNESINDLWEHTKEEFCNLFKKLKNNQLLQSIDFVISTADGESTLCAPYDINPVIENECCKITRSNGFTITIPIHQFYHLFKGKDGWTENLLFDYSKNTSGKSYLRYVDISLFEETPETVINGTLEFPWSSLSIYRKMPFESIPLHKAVAVEYEFKSASPFQLDVPDFKENLPEYISEYSTNDTSITLGGFTIPPFGKHCQTYYLIAHQKPFGVSHFMNSQIPVKENNRTIDVTIEGYGGEGPEGYPGEQPGDGFGVDNSPLLNISLVRMVYVKKPVGWESIKGGETLHQGQMVKGEIRCKNPGKSVDKICITDVLNGINKSMVIRTDIISNTGCLHPACIDEGADKCKISFEHINAFSTEAEIRCEYEFIATGTGSICLETNRSDISINGHVYNLEKPETINFNISPPIEEAINISIGDIKVYPHAEETISSINIPIYFKNEGAIAVQKLSVKSTICCGSSTSSETIEQISQVCIFAPGDTREIAIPIEVVPGIAKILEVDVKYTVPSKGEICRSIISHNNIQQLWLNFDDISHITERQHVLDDLDTKLQNGNKPVLLHGESGCGKGHFLHKWAGGSYLVIRHSCEKNPRKNCQNLLEMIREVCKDFTSRFICCETNPTRSNPEQYLELFDINEGTPQHDRLKLLFGTTCYDYLKCVSDDRATAIQEDIVALFMGLSKYIGSDQVKIPIHGRLVICLVGAQFLDESDLAMLLAISKKLKERCIYFVVSSTTFDSWQSKYLSPVEIRFWNFHEFQNICNKIFLWPLLTHDAISFLFKESEGNPNHVKLLFEAIRKNPKEYCRFIAGQTDINEEKIHELAKKGVPGSLVESFNDLINDTADLKPSMIGIAIFANIAKGPIPIDELQKILLLLIGSNNSRCQRDTREDILKTVGILNDSRWIEIKSNQVSESPDSSKRQVIKSFDTVMVERCGSLLYGFYKSKNDMHKMYYFKYIGKEKQSNELPSLLDEAWGYLEKQEYSESQDYYRQIIDAKITDPVFYTEAQYSYAWTHMKLGNFLNAYKNVKSGGTLTAVEIAPQKRDRFLKLKSQNDYIIAHQFLYESTPGENDRNSTKPFPKEKLNRSWDKIVDYIGTETKGIARLIPSFSRSKLKQHFEHHQIALRIAFEERNSNKFKRIAAFLEKHSKKLPECHQLAYLITMARFHGDKTYYNDVVKNQYVEGGFASGNREFALALGLAEVTCRLYNFENNLDHGNQKISIKPQIIAAQLEHLRWQRYYAQYQTGTLIVRSLRIANELINTRDTYSNDTKNECASLHRCIEAYKKLGSAVKLAETLSERGLVLLQNIDFAELQSKKMVNQLHPTIKFIKDAIEDIVKSAENYKLAGMSQNAARILLASCGELAQFKSNDQTIQTYIFSIIEQLLLNANMIPNLDSSISTQINRSLAEFKWRQGGKNEALTLIDRLSLDQNIRKIKFSIQKDLISDCLAEKDFQKAYRFLKENETILQQSDFVAEDSTVKTLFSDTAQHMNIDKSSEIIFINRRLAVVTFHLQKFEEVIDCISLLILASREFVKKGTTDDSGSFCKEFLLETQSVPQEIVQLLTQLHAVWDRCDAPLIDRIRYFHAQVFGLHKDAVDFFIAQIDQRISEKVPALDQIAYFLLKLELRSQNDETIQHDLQRIADLFKVVPRNDTSFLVDYISLLIQYIDICMTKNFPYRQSLDNLVSVYRISNASEFVIARLSWLILTWQKKLPEYQAWDSEHIRIKNFITAIVYQVKTAAENVKNTEEMWKLVKLYFRLAGHNDDVVLWLEKILARVVENRLYEKIPDTVFWISTAIRSYRDTIMPKSITRQFESEEHVSLETPDKEIIHEETRNVIAEVKNVGEQIIEKLVNEPNVPDNIIGTSCYHMLSWADSRLSSNRDLELLLGATMYRKSLFPAPLAISCVQRAFSAEIDYCFFEGDTINVDPLDYLRCSFQLIMAEFDLYENKIGLSENPTELRNYLILLNDWDNWYSKYNRNAPPAPERPGVYHIPRHEKERRVITAVNNTIFIKKIHVAQEIANIIVKKWNRPEMFSLLQIDVVRMVNQLLMNLPSGFSADGLDFFEEYHNIIKMTSAFDGLSNKNQLFNLIPDEVKDGPHIRGFQQHDIFFQFAICGIIIMKQAASIVEKTPYGRYENIISEVKNRMCGKGEEGLCDATSIIQPEFAQWYWAGINYAFDFLQ